MLRPVGPPAGSDTAVWDWRGERTLGRIAFRGGAMTTDWLRGVFPPIPTPFDEVGALALNRLRGNITIWSTHSLSGLVVLGSNGEAVHLNRDERRGLIATAREAAPEAWPIIAGCGALSTRETIENCSDAAEAGAHAALVLPPSYYRSQMTPDGLTAHFEAVADASPVPVIVYNMPACTGIDLDAQTIARIGEHRNVIGLKDSSGNVTKLATLRGLVRADFRILAGSAGFFLPALSVGADGGVLALANIAPENCVAIYEAFRAGDLEKAQEIQLRLVELNTAVTARHSVPGLKAAMDLLGLFGGPVRAPLQPASRDVKGAIEALLRGAGLL